MNKTSGLEPGTDFASRKPKAKAGPKQGNYISLGFSKDVHGRLSALRTAIETSLGVRWSWNEFADWLAKPGQAKALRELAKAEADKNKAATA